ncbi:MAG: hypothetical protein GSR86_00055 [Desulfurococcales archaeon]|nr:hypothetical protein [Desulfurococcales archaeon]
MGGWIISSHYPGPCRPWILVPLVIPRPSVSPGGAQASTRPSLSRGRSSPGEDLPVGGPIRGEDLDEDLPPVTPNKPPSSTGPGGLGVWVLLRSWLWGPIWVVVLLF